MQKSTQPVAPSEAALAELAKQIVLEISTAGLGTHEPGSWYREPEDHHLLKCGRHINTAQQIREGFTPSDAEGELGHLKNALCRITMALGKRLL